MDSLLNNYSCECYPFRTVLLSEERFLGNSSKINEVITNFPQRFVAQSFRSTTQSSFASGSQATAVSSLSSKISLRFFESLCSINEENWTNDFFFPSHFASLEAFSKTLVVSFLQAG